MSYPRNLARVLAASAALAFASGQTALNLKTQSRDVDFTGAVSTKPLQSGTALPAACSLGQMFFLSNAAAGSNVYGCTSTNIWTLESGGPGGSGGGASMASQLGDFAVSRTNSTTLTIGANCSTATPCNVQFGQQTFSFVSGGTVTLASGTGEAFVYISSTGVLTAGHTLTASCSSGCTAQSGITAFPSDALPLFTWTATGGTWDSSGGTDERSFLGTQVLTASAGIQLTQSAAQTIVSVDQTVVGLRVAVPATSSSACTTGSWAANSSFYFVCVGTNTWMRAALSSF